jgi:autotransporter-associated beta strand protein
MAVSCWRKTRWAPRLWISSPPSPSALTLNNTTATTFDGNIHGNAGGLSVVISGTGALTFTDDETYIGGTTIDSGATLNLGVDADGHSGSLRGNVTDNGTLEFSWSSTSFENFTGNISGAGKVEIGEEAIVELSGDNSFQGLLLESDATLDLSALGAAGNGVIDFEGSEVELRFERGAVRPNTLDRLAGLSAGDCIDLRGVAATSAVIENGKLVVLAGQAEVAQFQLKSAPNGLLLSTLQTSTGTFVYADVTVKSYTAQRAQLDLAMDGFAIIGTAANLSANIKQLTADSHVAEIVVYDNSAVTMSAAAAVASLPILRNANDTKGEVAISDIASNFAASIDALAPRASRIASITFTDTGPTAVLTLTKAQKTADSALLGEIVGPWIIDVLNTDQSVLQIGHGDGLTIDAVGGVDTIIGGGVSETFDIAEGFGSVTLVDLGAHLLGIGHDFVDLSINEFASFRGLVNHTTVEGANLVISKGGDTLTLDNMTLSQLNSVAAHFKFT